MIEVIDTNLLPIVLKKLYDCPQRNLYVLCDLIQYGQSSDKYTFYCSYSDGDNINWVLMTHLESAQIVIFKDEDLDDIERYLCHTKVLFCDDISFDLIKNYIQYADIEIGKVSVLSKNKKISGTNDHRATISDRFDEIANLICSDDTMGQINAPRTLSHELKKRYSESFGRCFVIEKDNEVICNVSTYAECKNYAVLSGIITNKEYRSRGFASSLIKYACEILQSEKKDIYLFWYKNNAGQLYHKLGFEDLCFWNKIFLSHK